MCDCYAAKCESSRCQVRLPIHIGDFRHQRGTVHVRCAKHPPPLVGHEAPGWEAFVRIEPTPHGDEHIPLMFIKCDDLGRPSSDDIGPNSSCAHAVTPVRCQYFDEWHEADVSSVGEP